MFRSRVAVDFGLKMPRKKLTPIFGTVAYKITAIYEGINGKKKLWKRNQLAHNRLVEGSIPSEPTDERPPD